MRVNQAWRRTGSTQANCAREPQRCRRLGLGLFSARERRQKRSQSQWKKVVGGLGGEGCVNYEPLKGNDFNFPPNFFRGFSPLVSIFILKFTVRQKIGTVLAGHQSFHKKIIKSCHSLSWKSLVKNFKTRLQNLAERFSLAVAIMICTSSPLGSKRVQKKDHINVSNNISMSPQSQVFLGHWSKTICEPTTAVREIRSFINNFMRSTISLNPLMT